MVLNYLNSDLINKLLHKGIILVALFTVGKRTTAHLHAIVFSACVVECLAHRLGKFHALGILCRIANHLHSHGVGSRRSLLSGIVCQCRTAI